MLLMDFVGEISTVNSHTTAVIEVQVKNVLVIRVLLYEICGACLVLLL